MENINEYLNGNILHHFIKWKYFILKDPNDYAINTIGLDY